MTLSELRSRTLERLGEVPATPVYFTAPEVDAALNRAQRQLCFLTLCLEATDTLALTGGTTYYTPRSSFSDWLAPLRIEVSAGSNPKLRPTTIPELRALSATWEADPGAPTRYGSLGIDLLFIWPRPAGSGTSLSISYAREPALLVMDADTPEIPAEYHADLIDYGIPWLRVKEGGQELAKAVRHHMPRFLLAAVNLGNYIRRRSLDLRYDTLPFELIRFDASRLLGIQPPKVPPQKTLAPKETTK